MKLITALFILCASSCFASDHPTASIIESEAKAPGLKIIVDVPEGWKTERDIDDSTSVAAIVNANDRGEMLLVGASGIPPNRVGQSDKVFDERFLFSFGLGLGADVARRVKNADWNGAYFEYCWPLHSPRGAEEARVKNWVTLIGANLVQFQCYFPSKPSLSPEEQSTMDERVGTVYEQILKSIRPANQSAETTAVECPPSNHGSRPAVSHL